MLQAGLGPRTGCLWFRGLRATTPPAVLWLLHARGYPHRVAMTAPRRPYRARGQSGLTGEGYHLSTSIVHDASSPPAARCLSLLASRAEHAAPNFKL